ncbi:MAG: TonB-dependent receptor [Peptostreptococcaceae bacterium]
MKNNKIITLFLIISALSYANNFEEVHLEESTIVSSTGFETNLKNVASNPIIITAKDIEQNNYKSVDEILNSIPSINIINQGSDKIIDLRGQGENAKTNVQVLVDGIQINSLDTSMTATPINTLDVNIIERIEVIPGGGAVLYGSGTAGGVVNIITKSGQGFRGNAGYRYSEFHGHKYTASIGESIEKFDIALDYAKENRDGYRDYNELDSDFFQGKITYNASETENTTLKYSKFKSEQTYPGALTRSQMNEDRKDWGRDPGEYNFTDTDKDEVVLTHNRKLSDNLDLNVSAFYQKTTLDLGQKLFMMYPITNFYMQQSSIFEDKKYGVKPKLKYSYANQSSVVFGIDYIKNKLLRDVTTTTATPPFGIPKSSVTINDLEKETISGFVHNTYKYNNFEFIQGLRYEKANYKVKRESADGVIDGTRDEDNFALELAINNLYSNTGNRYIKYEKGFTSPAPALLTNKENNGYYINDLKSETYDTFEIGIKDFIFNSYISATTFYTLTKDEITTDMTGGMPPQTIDNYNLDETKRFGVELNAEQWFDKLTLSQSYSYIHTKIEGARKNGDDYSGNEIAYVPKNRFKFGASYKFNSNFNTGFETIYTGSSYLNNANEGGRQNKHIITNIVGNYSFGNGLRVYAGINNLFNENYYNDIDYTVSTKSYSYDPAPKRNYYLGFNYSF